MGRLSLGALRRCVCVRVFVCVLCVCVRVCVWGCVTTCARCAAPAQPTLCRILSNESPSMGKLFFGALHRCLCVVCVCVFVCVCVCVVCVCVWGGGGDYLCKICSSCTADPLLDIEQ